MAKALEVKVYVMHLEKAKQLAQVIKDVVDDERIPAAVREEVRDRVNDILESEDAE